MPPPSLAHAPKSSQRWIRSSHPLACQRWDEEYVVHHPWSNDTHRLSEPAGLVLLTLDQQGPKDVDALASICILEPGEVETILEALAELSLVARC